MAFALKTRAYSADLALMIATAEERWAERAGKPVKVLVAYARGLDLQTRRPHKLYRDEGGLYIRTGFQVTRKRYLHQMAEAGVLDRAPGLIFYEEA